MLHPGLYDTYKVSILSCSCKDLSHVIVAVLFELFVLWAPDQKPCGAEHITILHLHKRSCCLVMKLVLIDLDDQPAFEVRIHVPVGKMWSVFHFQYCQMTPDVVTSDNLHHFFSLDPARYQRTFHG